MDRTRLLELALEELHREKAGVEEEIAALRNELVGTGAAARQTRAVAPLPRTQRRRKRTAAEKRAQSIRMKKIWAARRAVKAGKSTTAAKAAPAASVKEEKAELKKLAAVKTAAGSKAKVKSK